MKLTVTTDRLSGHQRGDVIDIDELEGVNVEALIAGGHVKIKRPKKASATAKKAKG